MELKVFQGTLMRNSTEQNAESQKETQSSEDQKEQG